MMRRTLRRTRIRVVVAAVVLLATFGAVVPAANAVLAWYWYTSPTQISSGNTFADYSFNVVDGHALYGYADGGARPQLWFVNSGGARVSAIGSCETLGCSASISWSGPYPSGYPAVHHHGLGANPDWFNARVWDSR